MSDNALETVCNVALNLPAEDVTDAAYVKRTRHRLKEQGFTAGWLCSAGLSAGGRIVVDSCHYEWHARVGGRYYCGNGSKNVRAMRVC